MRIPVHPLHCCPTSPNNWCNDAWKLPRVVAMMLPIGLPAESFTLFVIPSRPDPNAINRNWWAITLKEGLLSTFCIFSLLTSSLLPLPMPFITVASNIGRKSIRNGLNLSWSKFIQRPEIKCPHAPHTNGKLWKICAARMFHPLDIASVPTRQFIALQRNINEL